MSPEVDPPSDWTIRFGERHQLRRITEFPNGIAGPKKVRIYFRHDHYVLQWWDPGAKTNLSDRVNGDLVTTIVRAREIDERLSHFRSSGQIRERHLGHQQLMDRFLADLRRRADAGEIDPATVARFETALRHYLAFCHLPQVMKAHSHAGMVNREFRLAFAAFLAQRQVSGNGHLAGTARRMKGQGFVMDTVRAMLEWAADPDRGGLLPDGFRNPFLRSKLSREVFKGDQLSEPDITLAMAIEFVKACDLFQLRLFVPMIIFGLRAAEPCWLFREHLDDSCLRVPCIPELDYATKGRRDKRLPLIEELQAFWSVLRGDRPKGLLFERRSVVEGREKAKFRGHSVAEVIEEYRRQCGSLSSPNAAVRAKLRKELLRSAGGLDYDHIEQEFHAIARRLRWPTKATLKDFRHGFATMLGNSPMAEAYKKYLMGQSPGRAALNAYTHLNQLRVQFGNACRQEWTSLIETINRQVEVQFWIR